MRGRAVVVTVALLALAGCGDGDEGVTAGASPTTATTEVPRTLQINARYTGLRCVGGSAFYNGSEVVVKNESGVVLGQATSAFNAAASAGEGCEYDTTVADVPVSRFYVIEIDGKEYKTIPESYVESHGWVLNVTDEDLGQ